MVLERGWARFTSTTKRNWEELRNLATKDPGKWKNQVEDTKGSARLRLGYGNGTSIFCRLFLMQETVLEEVPVVHVCALCARAFTNKQTWISLHVNQKHNYRNICLEKGQCVICHREFYSDSNKLQHRLNCSAKIMPIIFLAVFRDWFAVLMHLTNKCPGNVLNPLKSKKETLYLTEMNVNCKRF